MQREELTEKLTAFESKHPVSEWVWHGWRVWPVVRTRLGLALHGDPDPAAARPGHGPTRLARSLAWRRQRLGRWLGQRLQPGADRPADVVFVTQCDRMQRLGSRFYNTVVDPWAEAFAASGSRVTVWSLGDPRWPTHVPHVSIQRSIDRARAKRGTLAIDDPPPWFETLAAWAAEVLDADISWSNLAIDFRRVISASTRLESWLLRARPRVLVLDCWYGREQLGAAIAAHRLGIPVVDLQHGVQGAGHFAYAGWSPPPAGGYEVFPDRFWVWGENDAESLLASNPGAIAHDQVEVVGNRWLSDWTERDDPRRQPELRRASRLIGDRHAVLVTLQEGVSTERVLEPLIRQAPSDWLWLVRLHRRMTVDPRRLEADLRRATGGRVDCVRNTRLPLYALLRGCAWHVTGFSTCAQEALAFGVPTLLTHQSGEHAYAHFVSRGVMWPHRTAAESVERLAGRGPQLAEACRLASRDAFAEPTRGGLRCTSS